MVTHMGKGLVFSSQPVDAPDPRGAAPALPSFGGSFLFVRTNFAQRPHRPESGDKVRRQGIRHIRSSDVEQSASDS